ncbi:serine protein kinase RIO [Candidatus Woesearchaeota archaeon]|jgi:RIO kinase 1|nr:serine protein kinase RIO [Candidatus Woesearchaeota archaeon]MBT5396808.1 serine protein kinase RIO [Candidatus Woesearchaeota archaeon]MBT6367696.1 serine protein kinase RIO [Candidatus Woesearchaeota archaeon]MBT7762903.1 serine protein kinase RIO [Candidatus Woesearchaeota archaeon]
MVTLTHQERFRTIKGVFDEFTNRTLFTLQSKGVFDELVQPLPVGKESNVFIASKGDDRVIVKIYRMQNCDFKRMYDYIRKDPRYENLRQKRREIILSWAQREYKNLIKSERSGVRVPKALGWKNHIIVEEFIGDEEPAPPLKDAYPENPEEFFDDVIDQMTKMYQNGLIHGDLSSFNILNYNEKPVIIDFSQATLVKTPNSEELLERDVKNVLHFFKKVGIKAKFEEVLKKITK